MVFFCALVMEELATKIKQLNTPLNNTELNDRKNSLRKRQKLKMPTLIRKMSSYRLGFQEH